MEEQQQTQEQQQHRGARGSGGRGGAGAAAQGPHHGGCLTRNGTPPAGNPGHPRRGVAATTSTVATPASSPASAPSQEIRGSQGGWEEKKKGRGAAKADWRAAPPATGVERGGVRPGRSGRAENPGAEAALPSRMRRGGSRAPLGGGRRGGAEPRHRAAAARSCGSPPHHLPPRGRLPSVPGGDRAGPSGRAEAGEGPQGGGFLQTRSGRDGSRRGRRGRRDACEAGAGGPTAPSRAGEERRAPGAGSREASGERGSGRGSPSSLRPAAARRVSSSRPPEGSREGGGGSAHAARSFRRRRCPNRGRPREKETK